MMFLRLFRYRSPEDRALDEHLRDILGFRPKHLDIYRTACHHKSILGQAGGHRLESNERLEYLGDAILNAIVAEYLFKKYPNADEGFLTKMRSKVVKRKTLNGIAEDMGIRKVLDLVNDTQISPSMLGNALEAILGAVYLDLGYERTKRYIIKHILQAHLNIDHLEQFDDNYKSQLLEHCQKHGLALHYQVIKKYRQQQRDRFVVEVSVEDKVLATGEGFNKKSAEQQASSKALKTINPKPQPNHTDHFRG